jgi:hypothetical protein
MNYLSQTIEGIKWGLNEEKVNKKIIEERRQRYIRIGKGNMKT